MTPIRIAVIIALLLVAGVVAKTPVQALGTAAQASSQTLNEVTSEQLLSSSVVAGWMAHPDAAGGALLDVLVLWRGTPGWWLTEGAHGGSGGGSFSTTTMHISRGGKELTVSFDVRTRIAHVLDKDIDVREANVVLIDDADAAGGPKVARTMTVAPQLPVPTRIDAAIRRSPDLIAFLRCDVRLPDPNKQAMMDLVCAPFIGK